LADRAWRRLVDLDRSFKAKIGVGTSISGRGSALAASFERAVKARPDLGCLSGRFNPIEFLSRAPLAQLGYRREATRFERGGYPGDAVLFGGGAIDVLRPALEKRLLGGGGVLAILPAEKWTGWRLGDLLGV
jgi:hypothetical protein